MIILYILSVLCTLVITFIVAAWLMYITKKIAAHITAKRIIIKQAFRVGTWFGLRFLFPIIFASSDELMHIIDGIVNDKKQENE